MTRKRFGLRSIAPGILVAATGVGAGDLLIASLAGSAVGMGILWAAVAGAGIKWFLTEGIARWQLATGTTILEGWVAHLGRWIQWVFLFYLLAWSVFTGGALVNACGVAGVGLCPLTGDPATDKVVWGIAHSLVGLVLVRMGGFRLFARMMSVCIAVMFVTVLLSAVLLRPDWSAVGWGLLYPHIPAGGFVWTLGVLGGVGGTVTILSYGYWIREAGRSGPEGIRACRIDLTIGYLMTAIFGVAMIIIGSRLELSKEGGLANVALDIAEQLAQALGPAGKWAFLLGFWGAVFSSLLGVWQSIPYLFADFWSLRSGVKLSRKVDTDLTKTKPYRVFLWALAIVPLPLLAMSVRQAQLAYAVLGSLFISLLALTLLVLNNRGALVGRRHRNGWLANAVLVATLALFLAMAVRKAALTMGFA